MEHRSILLAMAKASGAIFDQIILLPVNKNIFNKKMQHSCGVTHSIALSYQFQNTTILVNLVQLGLHQI